MSLREEFSADMESIEADFGNPTGTYLGTDYPCIPSGNSRATALEVGGFAVEIDFTVRIRTAALGSVTPLAGKLFAYAGTDYRIVSAWKDASGAFFNLSLQDPNR